MRLGLFHVIIQDEVERYSIPGSKSRADASELSQHRGTEGTAIWWYVP